MKQLSTKEFRESVMRRFKDKKVPVMGTFEITGRCNFDCKMCYVHTKPNAEYAKTERDGAWWISIIDEACEKGMLFALITGGECLLHPDFRRIYTHLRAKGVYTSINTNGYLLTQEMIDFLKKNPPYEIQITLYGTDEESYYKVTGTHSFVRVRESILRAKEAGLNLKVAVTPNPYAKGETERIVKYLKELSVYTVVNEALHTSYDDDKGYKLSDNQVDVEEKIGYLTATTETAPQPIPIEDLPKAGGGKRETEKGMRCSGGKAAFFVTQDGYMMPCPTAQEMRVPIDKAEEFEKAWSKIQERAQRFMQPVECDGCAYKKVCLSCPILRCGKVGNGHCDPKVCEVTRKLVAAGVKKLDASEKETCNE